MLLPLLVVAIVILVALLYWRRRDRRAGGFGPPAEERALIDRAARGDAEAKAELARRGRAEEAALKVRAASDPAAALLFLERKLAELQALGWVRDSLRSGGDAGAQTRVERQYAEVEQEVEWARGRTGGRR